MKSLPILVVALAVIFLLTIVLIGLFNPLMLVALLVGIGLGLALQRMGKSGR